MRRLVADTNLEARRAPINELNGTLSLKGCNSAMNIIGNDIAAVQQASSHVFAISRVALNHLIVWLEAGHRDLLNGVGLVGCFGGRDDWTVCNKREMDTGIRDQVGLEFVEINIERAIEAKGSGDG